MPSGGEELVELADVRGTSGDRLSLSTGSLAPGMGIGSDISNSVRLCAVEDCTPNDTLRSRLPPLRTKLSAIIAIIVVQTRAVRETPKCILSA